MYYKILAFDDEVDKVVVPENLSNQYSIFTGKTMKVKAGMKLKNAEIAVSPENDDIVRISYPLIRFLSLPTDISYQITAEDDTLHIGPVIGLLFNCPGGYLANSFLGRYLDYTYHYNLYKGLLCVFNYDGINLQDNTVEGYYYGNFENKPGCSWKEGTFPLPDVIYRRVFLDKKQMASLSRDKKISIFNSYYFNKWNFWTMVSSSEVLRCHIPNTRLFNSITDLDEMLQLHGTVYLKPAYGSMASGIIQVYKDENYHFRTVDSDHDVVIEDRDAADIYVRQLQKRRFYLIQQAVHTLNIGSRKADFRVVMQKDETGKWCCNAIVGKVGRENGISSNFTEHGYALPYEIAMEKASGLSNIEILMKKQELIDLCTKLCIELDSVGETFGDFGIDAAIDEDLHIWIFEANKEQDFSILRQVYGYEEYLSIKSNPTRCALGLTPFKIYKN